MDFHSVDGNLRHMFRMLAFGRESGLSRLLEGVEIAAAGTEFQMFNAVFLSTPVSAEDDLDRRVTHASLAMHTRMLPWAFWLCEDWLSRGMRRKAVKVMERRGLALASEMPGMCAEFVRGAKRKLPELEMRAVESEETRQAFCEIGATCFHVPLVWIDEIFDAQVAVKDDFNAWVAYEEGEPIATASTTVAGGVVGVYNVATLPSYRERGVAEAITRYALAQAKRRHGLDRSVLQATRQGLGLYERMGYASVTRFLVFTSRP
jgi:ribosomal protein S18 acetylase RimI-like enzyme